MSSVFDKPETINYTAENRADILLYVILSRRDRCLNTYELMMKQKMSNSASYINTRIEFKSTLLTLYKEIKMNFDDFMGTSQNIELLKELTGYLDKIHEINDDNILDRCFFLLDYYLFKNNITKLSTKEVFDKTDTNETDKHYGN